jgi:prepilin-type N-terminal cleavage/methylation domain-containing protein
MRFVSTGSPAAWLWNGCRRLCRAKRRPRPACHVGSRCRSTQPTQATHATRPNAGASAGFTLIEALAAIVILALALSALLSAHDTGLRGATAIDDHLQARTLAQSLLAQWSLDRAPQVPSKGSSGRFTWTVSIVPYAGAVAPVHQQPGQWALHELTVTVAWPPRREIRLSTLRLMSVR